MQQLQDILLKPLNKRVISKHAATAAAVHLLLNIMWSSFWNSSIKNDNIY